MEGVETEEQFQIVQNLKCTGAQGFPVWQADAGGGIPEAAYPGINGNKKADGKLRPPFFFMPQTAAA